MNKKSYILIGGTILIFIITITIILFTNNDKQTWIDEITNSQSYEITMTNCNGREKRLDKNLLTTINDNWNNLSNNGPWMGNNNICYTTITISYENNGIINFKKILLLDDSSLALLENNASTYYTNATYIITTTNETFTQQ